MNSKENYSRQFWGLNLVLISQKVGWSWISMLLSTTFVALLIGSCSVGIWQLGRESAVKWGLPLVFGLITVRFMFVALVTLFCPIKIQPCNDPFLCSALILPSRPYLRVLRDQIQTCTLNIMKMRRTLWPTSFNTFFRLNCDIQDIKQITLYFVETCFQ